MYPKPIWLWIPSLPPLVKGLICGIEPGLAGTAVSGIFGMVSVLIHLCFSCSFLNITFIPIFFFLYFFSVLLYFLCSLFYTELKLCLCSSLAVFPLVYYLLWARAAVCWSSAPEEVKLPIIRVALQLQVRLWPHLILSPHCSILCLTPFLPSAGYSLPLHPPYMGSAWLRSSLMPQAPRVVTL